MDSCHGFTLCDRLAKVLPEGCHFTVHHLSTPPTQSPPLYAVPPRGLAEETYCESHFLSISIDSNGDQLQVFGIEVLIYSTELLTTLFVSKADSTGYLYLLQLAPGTPSPLKCISTTFLRYLIEERRRTDRRLVLSLFARAQNQYLFPGSVENPHKHVLDDRGLIKWWCQVVDPILDCDQNDGAYQNGKAQDAATKGNESKSHGFLRVPGCDAYETKTFLPKDERSRTSGTHRWEISDPLRRLGKSSHLPERCLIPRFPDDPKARFVEQLDDELPEEEDPVSQTQILKTGNTSKTPSIGRWRSVKSLEEFWDMMSFRQECASGRLVGFLWAVFQTAAQIGTGPTGDNGEHTHNPSRMPLPAPEVSRHQDSGLLPPQSPLKSSSAPMFPSTPTSPAPALPEQTPTTSPFKAREYIISSLPEKTPYYLWPKSSRGEVILRQQDYKRAGILLLRLDYADRDIAVDSTKRWLKDVAEKAGIDSWGRTVLGKLQVSTGADAVKSLGNPTMLSAGLIRKKKRPTEESTADGTYTKAERGGINSLSGGLLRKKAKIAESTADVLPPEKSLRRDDNLVPG